MVYSRERKLFNAYLLAKFCFDTAENEPFQVCPLSAYRSPRSVELAALRIQIERLTRAKKAAVQRCAALRSASAAAQPAFQQLGEALRAESAAARPVAHAGVQAGRVQVSAQNKKYK